MLSRLTGCALILAGFMLAGCPPTIQQAACVSGQTSCEGTSLKTCTTSGTWFVGLCETGKTCQNGSCVSTTGGSCGDSKCEISLNETCATCPTDCGQCCGDTTCASSANENCYTCPADCGQCCGNGSCDSEFGESPSSCPTDCNTSNCNDGKLDTGEACDGINLNGKTCVDAGFTEGTLACATDCTFDTSGCLQGPTPWALNIESGHENPTLRAMTTDASGNIYLAGLFAGQLTGLGAPITAKGDYDYWVAKLSSKGELQWLTTNGAAGTTAGIKGVAVDSAGSVFVTGFFKGSFVTPVGTVVSSTNQSLLVAKLNSDGTFAWQLTHVP